MFRLVVSYFLLQILSYYIMRNPLKNLNTRRRRRAPVTSNDDSNNNNNDNINANSTDNNNANSNNSLPQQQQQKQKQKEKHRRTTSLPTMFTKATHIKKTASLSPPRISEAETPRISDTPRNSGMERYPQSSVNDTDKNSSLASSSSITHKDNVSPSNLSTSPQLQQQQQAQSETIQKEHHDENTSSETTGETSTPCYKRQLDQLNCICEADEKKKHVIMHYHQHPPKTQTQQQPQEHSISTVNRATDLCTIKEEQPPCIEKEHREQQQQQESQQLANNEQPPPKVGPISTISPASTASTSSATTATNASTTNSSPTFMIKQQNNVLEQQQQKLEQLVKQKRQHNIEQRIQQLHNSQQPSKSNEVLNTSKSNIENPSLASAPTLSAQPKNLLPMTTETTTKSGISFSNSFGGACASSTNQPNISMHHAETPLTKNKNPQRQQENINNNRNMSNAMERPLMREESQGNEGGAADDDLNVSIGQSLGISIGNSSMGNRSINHVITNITATIINNSNKCHQNQAFTQQQQQQAKLTAASSIRSTSLNFFKTNSSVGKKVNSPSSSLHADRIAKAAVALDNAGNELFARGDYDRAMASYIRALKLKNRTLLSAQLAKESKPQVEMPTQKIQVQLDSSNNITKNVGSSNNENNTDAAAVNNNDGNNDTNNTNNINKGEPSELWMSVATSINNIGYLRQQSGVATAEETMQAYQNSLSIKRAVLDKDNLSVGKTLNNLGTVHYLKHDYEKAIESYTEALGIIAKSLGNDHLDVGTVLSNIADAYYSQNKFFSKNKRNGDKNNRNHSTLSSRCLSEALSFYRRALEVRWKHLGSDDPKVMRLLQKIASIEMGELDEDNNNMNNNTGNRNSRSGGSGLGSSIGLSLGSYSCRSIDDDSQAYRQRNSGDYISDEFSERYHSVYEFKNLRRELRNDISELDVKEKEMATDFIKERIQLRKELKSLSAPMPDVSENSCSTTESSATKSVTATSTTPTGISNNPLLVGEQHNLPQIDTKISPSLRQGQNLLDEDASERLLLTNVLGKVPRTPLLSPLQRHEALSSVKRRLHQLRETRKHDAEVEGDISVSTAKATTSASAMPVRRYNAYSSTNDKNGVIWKESNSPETEGDRGNNSSLGKSSIGISSRSSLGLSSSSVTSLHEGIATLRNHKVSSTTPVGTATAFENDILLGKAQSQQKQSPKHKKSSPDINYGVSQSRRRRLQQREQEQQNNQSTTKNPASDHDILLKGGKYKKRSSSKK